jgi:hypothetical protein
MQNRHSRARLILQHQHAQNMAYLYTRPVTVLEIRESTHVPSKHPNDTRSKTIEEINSQTIEISPTSRTKMTVCGAKRYGLAISWLEGL